MKKVVLEHLGTLPTSVWEVIHLCAEANGSLSRIDLQVMEDINQVTCRCADNYSALPHITKGYYAVLFIIDSLHDNEIAFTNPGKNYWFSVYIRNPEKLINYLLG